MLNYFNERILGSVSMSVHYVEPKKTGQPTIRIETSILSVVKEIQTNTITLEFPVRVAALVCDTQPVIDWERFNQINYIR